MDKQQELVEIIGYSGHISDFAIEEVMLLTVHG
jgi:hypothetical protein